jgi:mannonate dehydratase
MKSQDEGRYLLTRRHMLCCTGAALLGLADSARAAPWAGRCGSDALPRATQDFVAQMVDGLDASALWDMHAHLLGNGDSGSGCTIHPHLTQGWHLLERARHRAILGAACVSGDAPPVDRAYVERLLTLAQGFPQGARWLLFAFEQAHDDAGRADPARTTMHVPDAYAAAVAAANPQRFGWVASIHPYREDALERLAHAKAGGALAVKWLPSAMNIDLRDRRCGPFYDTLVRTGLPLIVHCGEEKAVPGADREALGNPLLVRAACR